MISAAIQSTLVGIIPNTFLAMADESIVTPYCTHKETGTPEYVKEGICGYSYDCEVLIIDDTPEAVETLVQSCKNALLALTGTTVNGTGIELVVWDGEEPDFDMENKMFFNILKFAVLTSNR
jgi:hypothetical protein